MSVINKRVNGHKSFRLNCFLTEAEIEVIKGVFMGSPQRCCNLRTNIIRKINGMLQDLHILRHYSHNDAQIYMAMNNFWIQLDQLRKELTFNE